MGAHHQLQAMCSLVNVCACDCACLRACVRGWVYACVGVSVGVCEHASVGGWVCMRVYAYGCAYLQKSLCVVAVRTMREVCHTSLHNFNSNEEIGNWHAYC